MQAETLTLPDRREGASFVLGIGAQKAGTTWLHAWLSSHPSCVSGPMKEFHYFDAVQRRMQPGIRLRATALQRAHDRGAPQQRIARIERLQEICAAPDADHQSYLDLLLDGVPNGKIALDFTPEYSRASGEVFAQMAALPGVRMIFLLREPVARFWSALRMKVSRLSDPSDDFEKFCRDYLDELIQEGQGGIFQGTDYAQTLTNLETHVAADQKLILFYENLFEQDTADRVCQFLGIEPLSVTGKGVRNEGKKATMRPDQVAGLTELLRPQYDAVCEAFGDAVPPVWHERFEAGQDGMTTTARSRRRLQR